ncbi:MAG: type IVB secretion system protein IcmX [Legionella sp.]|nr:type IVB secretion system protein IcmX [Legionella sp.]
MQFKLNYVLQGILLAATTAVFAEEPVNNTNSSYFASQESEDLSNLTLYLQNLGKYFGYDLTQYCTTGGACGPGGGGSGASGGGGAQGGYSNALFNMNDTYAVQLNLFNSYLGALLGGGSSSTTPNPIVPSNTQTYSLINTLAGQTFSTPPYSSPSAQGVSVTDIIDQQTFQSDPVSQAVLNILATPDYTFCTTTNATGNITANTQCQILFREKIMAQVVGPLQQTKDVFTASYNQPLIPQLNSDTLISPLLYTTNASNANDTSSSPSGNQNQGLPAQTQAQQAANFIRYVSSAVNPAMLPSYTTYNDLISLALNYSQQTSPADQAQAQITIINYLTKLRTYAAQTSVGVGNLYYILSRRLPQNPVSGTGNPSSAALNEFIMASWRLYNPGTQNGGAATNQQWLTQINEGSSASVQKEIAILLAEINYQLYLSRQMQERVLLTESIGLLQRTQATQPNNDLTSQAAAGSTANSDSSTNPSPQ